MLDVKVKRHDPRIMTCAIMTQTAQQNVASQHSQPAECVFLYVDVNVKQKVIPKSAR
jgi:hypothetical protein